MADIKKIEDELWEAGTMSLMPHVGNNFLYTKCLPCTPRFFGKTSPELFATRFVDEMKAFPAKSRCP